MRKYQSSFFTVDFYIVISLFVLSVMGLLAIFSTSLDSKGFFTHQDYLKQLLFVIVGFVLMIVISLNNYRSWNNISPIIYYATIVFLFVLVFWGKEVNSSRSWVGLGSFGIQPGEFSKVSLILMLAHYFNNNAFHLKTWRCFLESGLICFIIVGLILLQPDLGTAIVHLGIYFIMALIAGVRSTYLFFFFLIAVFGGFFSIFPLWDKYITPEDINFFSTILLEKKYFFVYLALMITIVMVALYGYLTTNSSLYYYLIYFLVIIIISSFFALLVLSHIKLYQVHRLLVFINPNIDPQGLGWNARQSLIAVGAGGFWGRGYLKGVHSHNHYVPAQMTDFIFSIVAEEWGFIGSVFAFCIFMLILFRLYRLASKSESYFASLISVGVISMIFIHFSVNVGMAIGLFPIMGIPLPFISYGGSSLLAFFIALGLSLSVYRYR